MKLGHCCFIATAFFLSMTTTQGVAAQGAPQCEGAGCKLESKVQKKNNLQTQANQKCGTSAKPAPFGTVCGTTSDFICNGINTNCCARNDSTCLSGH